MDGVHPLEWGFSSGFVYVCLWSAMLSRSIVTCPMKDRTLRQSNLDKSTIKKDHLRSKLEPLWLVPGCFPIWWQRNVGRSPRRPTCWPTVVIAWICNTTGSTCCPYLGHRKLASPQDRRTIYNLWSFHEVSIVMGVPQSGWLYFMENPINSYSNGWLYPHFRKPPYQYTLW